MDLKVGENVQLKSGGPVMTIDSMDETEAICQWFDGNKLQRGTFALAALRRADETASR
jgi:uncharacterized protein YodC (DUF2158 family)